MIQASDDGHASQPFLLEGEDDTLGNGDGAMPANGAEALLDTPLTE